MRVLVTGANGQLGMTFQSLASEYPEHEFFFYASKELDITEPTSIERAFRESKPEVVINCAAYTAVDKAEDEPEKAFAVNANGVKNLADACQQIDSALIHISTDYVFDGTRQEPYVEEDEPNPINVYGESKLAGEKYVLAFGLKAIIFRTSWVYSEFGNNFVKTILRLARDRDELNVVSDQYGSPTYTKDLVRACLRMIDQMEKWPSQPTIYHYSNKGEISWFDFAKEIARLAGLTCKVNPILTEAYPTRAKRPKHSTLAMGKKSNDFKLLKRNWSHSLKECLKSLITS